MKKMGIIGSFAFETNDHGGQPVKTRQLYYELCKIKGKENIAVVEMFKESKIKVLCNCVRNFFRCKDIIMLPAHNGLPILTFLMSFLNKTARRSLHYVVIGGWLPEFLDTHKITSRLLKKNFIGIYVETEFMKKELKQRGFANIYIFPNYKELDVVCEKDLSLANDFPTKACFFSRVTEKKGVIDAIKVVTQINEEAGKTIIKLDIYGSIHDAFKSKFELLMANIPDYIKYKGAVDYDKTVQVLKNYDLQLFPTKFKTEGTPGSVVESFFAGVPVIASRWNSFADVIEDGVTGIGFEFENYDDFKDKLQNLICDHEKINKMKINCVHAAEKYKAECKKKVEMYF